MYIHRAGIGRCFNLGGGDISIQNFDIQEINITNITSRLIIYVMLGGGGGVSHPLPPPASYAHDVPTWPALMS